MSKYKKLISLVVVISLLPGPAHAQFGGGWPKIPEGRMLDNYQGFLAETNLSLKPVSAGLSASSPRFEIDDVEKLRVNPANYRATEGHLQKIIRTIAAKGPRPDIVPRVELINSDRVEAVAVSQDLIQVNLGLTNAIFKQAGDGGEEDALNSLFFVMAHEYSHVLYNHPAAFAEKLEDTKISKIFGASLAIASQLQPLANVVGGDIANANRQIVGGLTAGTALSPILDSELARAVYAPYKKQEEANADFMATDLMRLLPKFDPAVGSRFLNSFEKYDNSVVGQLKAGIKHLKKQTKDTGKEISAIGISSAINADFSGFQNNFKALAGREAIEFIIGLFKRRYLDEAHLYHSAEKRVGGVDEYLTTYYEPIEEPVDAGALAALGVASFSQMQSDYKREHKYDEAASEAKRLYSIGDLPGARAVLNAVDGRTKAPTAEFHLTDAIIWQAQGNFEEAELSYKRTISKPEASYRAYGSLAALYNLKDDYDAADAVLAKAEAKFGEQQVIVAKINQLILRDKLEEAQSSSEDCIQKYPSLQKSCEKLVPQDEKEKKIFGLI